MSSNADHVDLLIVGAGISGISMAAHMQEMCPDLTFSICERRAEIGGTWDLFRYPGVRSDSDMHSLGFRFEPWTDEMAIAGGGAIREYLRRTVESRDIAQAIRLGSRVTAADWSWEEARWNVTIEDDQGSREVRCRFLYLSTGYYDYDDPHAANLPGLDNFSGPVAHPQFWPQDLDYDGKRVVVIGSGATAVSIVPAMAERATHVTMLQRTPTWMAAGPSIDRLALFLRRWLPGNWAYRITRQINIRLHHFLVRRARAKPDKFADLLRAGVRSALGDAYRAADFDVPYPPWNQRLCLVPDGDLFEVIRAGKASVVTAAIDRVESGGVRLAGGQFLPAELLVTATGLRLSLGGKIAVSIGKRPVDWTNHWFYRGCMFSNVPNLAAVFGYLDASWTLRADNNADYICRVLQHMMRSGSDVALPLLPDGHGLEEAETIHLSSGYLRRARDLMPKSSPSLPWRLNMNYLEDRRDFRQRPISDGVLRFERAVARTEEIA